MFDNINKDELIQSIINPLGGLNLSDSERKLLFFRHVGAEYAMAARRNRVPFASNITRAGTAFSGLGGGGTDPMMLLVLSGAFSGDKDNDKKKKKKKSDIEVLADVVTKLSKKVDSIATKAGVGS